jgi:hypothetical protein
MDVLKIKRMNRTILEELMGSNEKLIYSSEPYYKENLDGFKPFFN